MQKMLLHLESEEEYDGKEKYEKDRGRLTLALFDVYATKGEMLMFNAKRAKSEVIYALIFEFVACDMKKDLVSFMGLVANTYLDDEFSIIAPSDDSKTRSNTSKKKMRPITHDAYAQSYVQETFSMLANMDLSSGDGTKDEYVLYHKFAFLFLLGREPAVQKCVLDLQMEHEFETPEEREDVLDRMERLYKRIPPLTDGLTLKSFNTHTSTRIILNFVNECAFIYERLV